VESPPPLAAVLFLFLRPIADGGIPEPGVRAFLRGPLVNAPWPDFVGTRLVSTTPRAHPYERPSWETPSCDGRSPYPGWVSAISRGGVFLHLGTSGGPPDLCFFTGH